MKKVLVLHEKHSVRVFDISTEDLKAKAYLKIFQERKKLGWYSDVAGDSISYADASKKPLYYAQVAAEKFITRRSEQGCEYERVEILEVE